MHSNKLWLLKRVNLLHALSTEQMRRLQQSARERVYARRQMILAPNEVADQVYLIREGRVKLSRFDERGREITLGILEAGELFGEEALGASNERRDHAEALTPVTLLQIPAAEFERLLEENPSLARAVLQHMTQRLMGAHEQIDALSFQDVTQRLIATLLRLSESHGAEQAEGGVRIEMQLTHQEIAALIGSTRETTTTLINRLKRQALLENDRRWIVLPQPQRLRSLLGNGSS